MKEERYFYVPGALEARELPPEEAAHALRVLRLEQGDELMLQDGEGCFYRAVISGADGRRCFYDIVETLPQQRSWEGHLHLALAPTKMMERTEWLVEKATEIGFDELSLLDCRFSERHVVKTARLEKIAVAAMKQSRKAWKPVIHEMQDFNTFISRHCDGARFIAHCYDEVERQDFFQELQTLTPCRPSSVTVMVGPEGDFAIDEVRRAVCQGFVSVHLGSSRLRTETAGLTAVMMMQLARRARWRR